MNQGTQSLFHTDKRHRNHRGQVHNQSPWFWEKVHGLKFQLMFREVKIGNGEPQHRASDAEELAKTAPRGARGGR